MVLNYKIWMCLQLLLEQYALQLVVMNMTKLLRNCWTFLYFWRICCDFVRNDSPGSPSPGKL